MTSQSATALSAPPRQHPSNTSITRLLSARWRALALAVACTVQAACAAQPLSDRPVDTGANTTESERKALEGTWRLLSLDVATEDGRKAAVPAKGELTLDGFGNLNIEYRVTDEGLKALEGVGIQSPNPVISTKGKAAIDPTQHRVTYVGQDQAEQAFDRTLAARRANPFALERVRYYTLGADGVLTLTTRHDNGRDAATSRWQKVS